MQINAINNANITFGHKLPAKKTYRAMQCYYEVLNDKSTAIEYKMLYHDAKARLHRMRQAKAETELLDYAESAMKDSKLKFAKNICKLGFKAVYERLANIYYSWV